MNKKPLCALVIGHSQESPGAINEACGLSEFAFNEIISMDIAAAVQEADVVRVNRHSYTRLPSQINQLNPDFIISLHCNAFNQNASGTEVLYYQGSLLGQQLAALLQPKLIAALQLRDRGLQPVTSRNRGGFLLHNTLAPAIIAEPFFIDNDDDLLIARKNTDQLVNAYAETIEQFAYALQS